MYQYVSNTIIVLKDNSVSFPESVRVLSHLMSWVQKLHYLARIASIPMCFTPC